jgi:hypothetical protein
MLQNLRLTHPPWTDVSTFRRFDVGWRCVPRYMCSASTDVTTDPPPIVREHYFHHSTHWACPTLWSAPPQLSADHGGQHRLIELLLKWGQREFVTSQSSGETRDADTRQQPKFAPSSLPLQLLTDDICSSDKQCIHSSIWPRSLW